MIGPWDVEDWIISGNFTGYRVVRRGPKGAIQIAEAFVCTGRIDEPTNDYWKGRADQAAYHRNRYHQPDGIVLSDMGGNDMYDVMEESG